MARTKKRTQAWDSGKECFFDIPGSVFYVLAEDSFMSRWGHAERRINTVVVPCGNRLEIERAITYLKGRIEMKRIRYAFRMPRPRAHVLYSVIASWAFQEPVNIDIRYESVEQDEDKRFVAEVEDERKEGYTDEEIAARFRVDLEKITAVP